MKNLIQGIQKMITHKNLNCHDNGSENNKAVHKNILVIREKTIFGIIRILYLPISLMSKYNIKNCYGIIMVRQSLFIWVD